MLKGIDHIVVVVPDLESAISGYEGLGFTVVRGGKHPIGSHNALVALADGAYLELIAFRDRGIAHPWNQALAKGGGIVDYCMQTDDLPGDVAALRRAGVAMSDSMPLTRERPDGYKLSWVLALPPAEYAGVIPFLIRDETPREERIPRERAQSNGVTGISRLTIAVGDADAAGKIFAAAFGTTGVKLAREDLSARGVRLAIGAHQIEFLAPASPGPIADWLRIRGPSPYAAILSATGGNRGALDPERAQGARLLIGSGES